LSHSASPVHASLIVPVEMRGGLCLSVGVWYICQNKWKCVWVCVCCVTLRMGSVQMAEESKIVDLFMLSSCLLPMYQSAIVTKMLCNKLPI
jgi:hypothetical protein